MRRTGLVFLMCALILSALTPVNAGDEKITLDNLDPIRTSQEAFANVNSYIDEIVKTELVPTLYISDAARLRNYDIALNGMDRIATLWSELIPTVNPSVVLFTETDGAWVDEMQKKLTGSWMRDNELQSERLKKYGCNMAGMYLPGVLFFCVNKNFAPENTSGRYGQNHTFAHEFTHFMEMNVKNWLGNASGSPVGRRNSCWIEEGFATFYGFAVGSYPNDKSGKSRREFLRHLTFNYDDRRNNVHGTLAKELVKGNASTIKNLMAMLENTPWPCDETQNAYAFGSLAAEALVASFGHARMVSFYKSSAVTGDWKKSFLEVFGLTSDSFYEKLTPYIAAQFNESNFPTPTPTPTPTPNPNIYFIIFVK